MSEVKFTEEELKKLKSIQKKYFDVQNAFGQVAIAKINLNQQFEDLNKYEDDLQKNFSENRKDEQNFVDEVTKKYVDGKLNLETGTFIPSNKNK